MGEADRYREYKSQPVKKFTLGQTDNHVALLLIINIVCFLLLMFVQVVINFSTNSNDGFEQKVLPWIGAPASFSEWIYKPWTIITYFFSDYGYQVFRLVGNMIWLWVFGNILQEMSCNDKIIPAYVYGGFMGALFFMVAGTLWNGAAMSGGYLLGANTAVVGVAMAATTLSPGYRIFKPLAGGFPLWVLMALFMLINLAGASFNNLFSIAQLGACIAGFAYIYFIRRGYDAGGWIQWLVNKIVGTSVGNGHRSLRQKVFYKTERQQPYSKSPIVTQQRVDEILDKINKKGFSALSEEEKKILKSASED